MPPINMQFTINSKITTSFYLMISLYYFTLVLCETCNKSTVCLHHLSLGANTYVLKLPSEQVIQFYTWLRQKLTSLFLLSTISRSQPFANFSAISPTWLIKQQDCIVFRRSNYYVYIHHLILLFDVAIEICNNWSTQSIVSLWLSFISVDNILLSILTITWWFNAYTFYLKLNRFSPYKYPSV